MLYIYNFIKRNFRLLQSLIKSSNDNRGFSSSSGTISVRERMHSLFLLFAFYN